MQFIDLEKTTDTKIPLFYEGKILNKTTSDTLRKYLISYINQLNSINEFILPSILYIAAWENNNNDIWYEYAGENFKNLFSKDIKKLPESFRSAIIDRKVYTKNENKVKIQTQTIDFLLNKKTDIRLELKNSGFNEAVYKIKVNEDIIWLKDQAVVIPFEDDDITISIGNLTNVTNEMSAEEARKKTEKKLARKERLLRSLFNQAYDPVILFNEKGYVVECNKIAEIFLKIPRNQLTGTSYQSYFSQENLEKLSEKIEILKQDKKVLIETEIINKSGQSIPIEINAVKIDNHPPVIQAVLRDITEKKQLENQKINESKFQLFSTMTSGIAHDTNNILSIIKGNLSLAELESSKLESSKLSKILDRINNASTHLEMLIKKLFAFSNTPQILKTNIDIKEFFHNIIGDYPDINISTDFLDEIENLLIDRKIMEEVIRDILTNSVEALKETKDKKIEIAISKTSINTEKNITVPEDKNKYIKISIKDNGCGMEDWMIDRVFDPYFTTKPFTSNKGTGLGLTHAYTTIKQHRGHIVIKSSKNTGTTIKMYLPE